MREMHTFILICCTFFIAVHGEGSYKSFDVEFTTDVGAFTLHVVREAAPLGADRFKQLLELPNGGYFRYSAFFRMLPGFVCQFGIAGDPGLSALWRDKPINDDPVKWSNLKGTLTYATSGPNTRTTQLFINLRDNSGLDAQGFAPFANVTSGMDILDKLDERYGQWPLQTHIYAKGNAYLQEAFPKIHYIVSTAISNVKG